MVPAIELFWWRSKLRWWVVFIVVELILVGMYSYLECDWLDGGRRSGRLRKYVTNRSCGIF